MRKFLRRKFNPLSRDRLSRMLELLSVRVCNSNTYRHSYAADNYPSVSARPLILDVGANIGQSAIWYAKAFKGAEIHAFEPIESVYKNLTKNTRSFRQIFTHQLAVGEEQRTIMIPRIESGTVQTTQVLGCFEKGPQCSDEVRVTTVDQFVSDRKIEKIDIIKTDTEGYELDVIAGSKRMLESGKVTYFLVEAGICEFDSQHTSLWSIIDILSGYGYRLRSVFDVSHRLDGGLNYCNALFERSEDTSVKL